MKEIDLIIISLLNKKGAHAKCNIAMILAMSNLNKLKMLDYLVRINNAGIIPSDKRVRKKINEILGGDIK